MVIVVTGTPCTGKSTLARKLAKSLGYEYVNVNSLVKGICSGYDDVRECVLVNTDKLNKKLISLIRRKKKLVIDSHLSHYLPSKYVDVCVVCKCELKELKKRLQKRGYSKLKVRENLDAEIFDICLVEAQEEMGHNVMIVETDKRYRIKDVVKRVKDEAKLSGT